ncbi:hypothetical protein FOXG_22938 [Fusarium oxysporum f. sp. lycopersici 4287]|uniref:Uncharacterized protein n=1 Tax=Fusarium oxysporum f. sp. lycopersici (strain 4287 / CBS 123668 / FGSC 9935 / NRRL 34936) TaxID=426428 RepID=A0A0J9WD21_FUSO4|nr:uncharacterized protein FOXG_22938 [Fusarium oxysporum f. sp. lycopersici 4287]KNB20798.1 hypothetical protein FOXG_22938 [Fusarium oxysporum f. sp. lycopersici 4287]
MPETWGWHRDSTRMVKGIWSSGKEWIVPVRYYDILDGWAPFAVVSCVGAFAEMGDISIFKALLI